MTAVYICTGASPPKTDIDVDALEGCSVTVTGIVTDRQEKNDSFLIYLREVTIITDKTDIPEKSKGMMIKLSDRGQGRYVKIGSKVEARGVFAPFDVRRCEGQFDMRTYYLVRGYEGRLVRARIVSISKRYGWIRDSLRRIRDEAFSILRNNMSEEDASLVAAMTLGDKSGLDAEVKELYQNAGISHVLALSGLHIASVGLALLKMLKKTGLGGMASGITAFIAISLYAVMTGMSTSTVRAMIMFGLYILSTLTGRTYDLLSAAAVSAVLILAEAPYYIYDAGFLLSFGAVLAIACVYPVYVKMPEIFFKNRGKDISGSRIYQSICISLSVMTVTMPVMGMSFMQITLGSVIVNIIVVPLMGVVLFTGFTGMIIGFLGPDPGLIFKITHYILRFYELCGRASEKIDGNIFVIGKPEKYQIITYAIIVITAVITAITGLDKKKGAKRNVDRAGRRALLNNNIHTKILPNKITYNIIREKDERKREKKKITRAYITLVMLGLSFLILLIHPRRELEIRSVDVGQGDCTLIWGDDIPTVMIDGGSSDIRQVAKYRILPVLKSNRMTCVDYCILTHMDSDHVSGVIEILEDDTCPVKIKSVVVSGVTYADTERNDNFRRLVNAAGSRTKIVPVSSGDVLKFRDTRLTVLSPVAKDAGIYADINEASVVLRLDHIDPDNGVSFSGLFTGDIGEMTERMILNDLTHVNYLKVAHHGSRNSSSDDFISVVHPDISVISAGVDNSYGHPHKETLSRLKAVNSKIIRTDERGEVILTFDDGAVSVRTVIGEKDNVSL